MAGAAAVIPAALATLTSMRLALFLLLLAPAADAAQWRLRARENFESGVIDMGGEPRAYRGAISAFDLFYEEPFGRSYGLTLHYGGLGRAAGAGRVTVTALGLEAKRFVWKKLFLRGGLLSQATDPAGPGRESWTWGGSGGLGWEFPVWRLGLAPELGGKALWGARGRRVSLGYLALGVHFYVFPGDGSGRRGPAAH